MSNAGDSTRKALGKGLSALLPTSRPSAAAAAPAAPKADAKVIHIGPASVEIEDVLYNNKQNIPLTQAPG